MGSNVEIDVTNQYLFYINETTGYIFTNSSGFDREQCDRYELILWTTSQSVFNISNINQATVEITILDRNDETPVFSPSTYSFFFDENSPQSFFVGTVSAMDLDQPGLSNSEIRFSMVFKYINSSVEGPYLEIHPETGDITVTAESIDYERYRNLTVILTATDQSDPYNEMSIELDISVIDLNDNTPVFSQNTYRFNVTENSGNNTLVETVVASDIDDTSNSDLTYSFQGDVSWICLVLKLVTIF